MSLISVLVPVYNVEAHLPRCIDSILAQSFQDFELILVNDGSCDGSGRICNEYAARDPRIRAVHQENRGVSAARNHLLELARRGDGTWVAFVDSDDTLAENYLERLLCMAQQYEADIASCSIFTYTEQQILEQLVPEQSEVAVISGKTACTEVYQINGMMVVSCPGKLIRKSLFDDIEFPEGKNHEDEAIIPRVMYRAKRIAVCKDLLYYYFMSENSIMRSDFSIRRFEALEAIDSCIEFFKKQEESEIAEEAEKRRTVMLALNVAYAKRADLGDQIPDPYRIPEWKAMWRMQQCTSFDEFCWHLAKFYPRLVKPYSYLWKLAKILHFTKRT